MKFLDKDHKDFNEQTHVFKIDSRATVAFKMLAWKVTFWLMILTSLAQTKRCREIMTSFFQTEDKFYDLGCDEEDLSSKTLLYQCRFLQKKMDIVGRQYYDFGVSFSVKK